METSQLNGSVDQEQLVAKILAFKGELVRPIIHICGLGGVGKTTFSKQLVDTLQCGFVFNIDYYATYPTAVRKARIKEALDSGDPARIEAEEHPVNWSSWDLLVKDLSHLRETGQLSIKDGWNQANGEKDYNCDIDISEHEFCPIVCEGIYLLHPGIRELGDLKVLLEAPVEICNERMKKRDAHRSSEDYLKYKESLAEKYCIPYFQQYGRYADLTLSQC